MFYLRLSPCPYPSLSNFLSFVSFSFSFSCSDNGSVVVSTVGLGAEDKDTVVHFNQSMKAVCVENDSGSKKDKSFLVGKNK